MDTHDPMGPCLEWQGARTSSGYGRVKCGDGHKLIHRLVFESHMGREIPEGVSVLHRCDNPPCYKLEHLYGGSHEDNMRDLRIARHLHGERNGKAKLTDDDVREIRRLYDEEGWIQREIGEAYGIHQVQVSAIVRRVAWPHVT